MYPMGTRKNIRNDDLYLWGEELYQRIRLLWMQKGGRSMAALAQEVGMNRCSFSHLARNESMTLRNDNLARVAQVLGISIDELTMREPPEKQEVEVTPIPDGFIKLTSVSGLTMYIKKECITTVYAMDGCTEVDTPSDSYSVSESADEIIKMLL